MNWQIFVMRNIFHQFVNDLYKFDISFVNMSCDFVIFVDLQRDLIFIFVNIFVNIFNNFDENANFYVNINLITMNKIRIVKNYLTIVENKIVII